MPRQATGRATLAPVERSKGGTTYWQARGQIPIRKGDGSVGSRRVERGFGDDCKTSRDREAQCAAWNAEYEERFRNPRQLLTVAKAFQTYVRHHPLPYYAEEILEEIGESQCSEIDDMVMADLETLLWPDGASAGTINRHLYTPVRAMLRMVLKEKAPLLTRPKGHNQILPLEIPDEHWFRTLVPALNPNHQALVMFLAMHGRRLGEALSRQAIHFNPERGTLDLGITKNRELREVSLHPSCLRLMLSMPNWHRRKWLFGAGPASQNSLRRDLKKVTDRLELRWYSPHEFGRHFSVTRMLRAGYSVKHVADANGMTPDMVTKRYSHLTKRESTDALHEVGGALYDTVFNVGEARGKEVVELDPMEQISDEIDNIRKRLKEESQLLIPAPSEGDALSICATGALDNQGSVADDTGRNNPERTENNGGRTGES
jgi:hypothetical protein